MPIKERIDLYQKIEAHRNRSLIVYVTSLQPGAGGQMAPDVIQEFTRQIIAIPKDKKDIDLLIVSNGGDPTVAWRIITILRERFKSVEVLLPYAAFSAATLLALGANKIIMHPFSNLGPVDPQLTYTRRIPGQQESFETIVFGSEDISHFLNFVRKDVGILDQEQLQRAFELVCKDVGAIPIGIAKRSTQLSLSMGENLLSLHMTDKSKAKAIAEALNKSFYSHGYPLGRKEAKEIGLSVSDADETIEELLWKIWEDLSNEMECHKPFNPAKVIFDDPELKKILEPVQQVQLPPNLPPNILQQSFQQIMQQVQIVTVKPVYHEQFNAVVESIGCRSEYKTKCMINAVRRIDLSIAVNVVKMSQGWNFIPDNGK
jgi:hypothetical protein